MNLFKRTTKKDNKVYTNYYLVAENGTRIPIEVKLIKKDGKVLNKYDLAKLNALAKPYVD